MALYRQIRRVWSGISDSTDFGRQLQSQATAIIFSLGYAMAKIFKAIPSCEGPFKWSKE